MINPNSRRLHNSPHMLPLQQFSSSASCLELFHIDSPACFLMMCVFTSLFFSVFSRFTGQGWKPCKPSPLFSRECNGLSLHDRDHSTVYRTVPRWLLGFCSRVLRFRKWVTMTPNRQLPTGCGERENKHGLPTPTFVIRGTSTMHVSPTDSYFPSPSVHGIREK